MIRIGPHLLENPVQPFAAFDVGEIDLKKREKSELIIINFRSAKFMIRKK